MLSSSSKELSMDVEVEPMTSTTWHEERLHVVPRAPRGSRGGGNDDNDIISTTLNMDHVTASLERIRRARVDDVTEREGREPSHQHQDHDHDTILPTATAYVNATHLD
jgi:hypothetical protein